MNDANKINILIKDFEAIHKSLINNSNMRLGVLGASLTLLGLIISFASNVKFPEILGVYIILVVVVFAFIRIIAAVNRTIFVFANHIKWVEQELDIMGFFTYWGNYLKKNIKDSGSYAFIIASKVINLSISVYIIFASITYINLKDIMNFKNIYTLIVILISITTYFFNERHIKKELDPRGYEERISKGLEEARAKKICEK